MSAPWPSIVAFFKAQRSMKGSDAFLSALMGVEQLAVFIADGPLGSTLFGSTSMHGLCIQQFEGSPYPGPYLRVSPLASGMVEFSYVDTGMRDQQWRREVPPDATVARLESFMDQLRWTPQVTVLGGSSTGR